MQAVEIVNGAMNRRQTVQAAVDDCGWSLTPIVSRWTENVLMIRMDAATQQVMWCVRETAGTVSVKSSRCLNRKSTSLDLELEPGESDIEAEEQVVAVVSLTIFYRKET